jgi:hypothetical protein
MANVTYFPSAAPQLSRDARIEATMTDFLAITQALKPIAYGEDYGVARDYLIERLDETYRTLDELHREEGGL